MKHLCLSLIILLVVVSTVKSQEFNDLVFSGFVEFTTDSGHSEENIDFSKIEILLLTEDNKVVEKTHCSSNGFYLLPVYDRKSYRIKVKPTLETEFEPEHIKLDLTKKSVEEIKAIAEGSFNFRFVGFVLENSILSEGSNAGPNNIPITLYNSKGEAIAHAKSGADGKFGFEKLNAGTYVVELDKPEDDSYTIHPKNSKITCELDWKKEKKCQGQLKITGYSFKGKIAAESHSLASFVLFLYKQGSQAKQNSCNQPALKEHPLAGKSEPYCYSKIDQNGTFTFTNVENGDYIVHVYSNDPLRKIEIEPETYNLKISHGPVQADDVFRVNRFSIRGRVVDTAGEGIPKVSVSLDGEVKAVSDANGYYALEKVKTGTYTLEGHHEHLFFEPIHDLKLVASLEKLPDLVLSYLHVCGSVALKPEPHEVPSEFQNVKVTIYLESKTDKRSAVPEKDGNFCFEVKPGKYNVYPLVSNYEKAKDVLLFPRTIEVKAFSEPVLDLLFYRPRLRVEGFVTFLNETLPQDKAQTRVVISSANKQFQQSAKIEEKGTYNFGNILPGVYDLSIENENLCWRTESIPIEINKLSNTTDQNFTQTGFTLKYSTPKELIVKIVDPTNVSSELKLSDQDDRTCVAKAGLYKLYPDNCYLFNQTNFVYDTRKNETLVFNPIKLLVRGFISIDDTILQNNNFTNASSLAESIALKMEITSQDRTPESVNVSVKFDKADKNTNIFSYFYYMRPFSAVNILPSIRKSSKLSSYNFLQNLLFYPEKIQLDVKEQCIKNTPVTNFEIRPGVIFAGRIIPQIEDLKISIFIESEERKDELLTSIVNSEAGFKLGPFIDSYQYRIEAVKEGYKFEKVLEGAQQNVYNYTFYAQKLSTLRVIVEDEDKKPVPGVLIFISSTSKKNFQKLNFYTNEAGYFLTNDLVKGEYFIKSVLKEYSFNPSQQTIELYDGETKNITISAKRIAFSIFGNIINLNGDGIENLEVQAITDSQEHAEHPTESAVTDSEGKYRIRGLIPGVNYKVGVVPSQNVLSVKPKTTNITIEKSDIQNIDFLMFEKPSTFSISGSINFDETFTPSEIEDVDSIEIKLFAKGSSEPIQKRTVRLFRYYEFTNLTKKDYHLQVTYRKLQSSSVVDYEQIIDSSNFGENHRIVKPISLKKTGVKPKELTNPGSSFFAPIIILILILGFFNMDTLQEYFKKYQNGNNRRR